MEKNLTIRNSTAEFLIFQAQDKSQGVEVVYHDETIRATQFRHWCTYVLRQFAIRGYIIDKKPDDVEKTSTWERPSRPSPRFDKKIIYFISTYYNLVKNSYKIAPMPIRVETRREVSIS